MDFKVYKGVISSLGDATSTTFPEGTINCYTYIELDSGEIIKKISTMSGLDGKLTIAFKAQDAVELHVAGGKSLMILAIKGSDGRIFASDMPGPQDTSILVPWIIILISLPLMFIIVGIFTIGTGATMLGFALGRRKQAKVVKGFNDYIDTLPNAIRI